MKEEFKLKKIIFPNEKCPYCNEMRISYIQKMKMSILRKEYRCNRCNEIIKITDWFLILSFVEIGAVKLLNLNNFWIMIFLILYFLQFRYISITKNIDLIKVYSNCPHCKQNSISYLNKAKLYRWTEEHVCKNCNGLIKFHPLYLLLILFELIVFYNVIIITGMSAFVAIIIYFIIELIQLYIAPVSKG